MAYSSFKSHQAVNTSHETGFTLVELSIVLVIIGLIVGGVLTGRDMIRAAEIRSTISQLEGYNTAVNTFRDKFGGIPGDLVASRATQFGMVTRTGAAGHGDGNRLVEGCAAGATAAGCETVLFWRDLSSASMVEDTYGTATDALAPTSTAATLLFPAAKLGQGNFIGVYPGTNGRNNFQLAGITGIDSATAGEYDLTQGLTPQTAFNLDDKIDDGNPATGSVRAAFSTTALGAIHTAGAAPFDANGATASAFTTGATANACSADPTGGQYVYNTNVSGAGDTPACQLSFRASF